MNLGNSLMFELPHYEAHDGSGLRPHSVHAAQAIWTRLTTAELSWIRTTSELIERVEEAYSLSHEQATRDVEFWALDKQL